MNYRVVLAVLGVLGLSHASAQVLTLKDVSGQTVRVHKDEVKRAYETFLLEGINQRENVGANQVMIRNPRVDIGGKWFKVFVYDVTSVMLPHADRICLNFGLARATNSRSFNSYQNEAREDLAVLAGDGTKVDSFDVSPTARYVHEILCEKI